MCLLGSYRVAKVANCLRELAGVFRTGPDAYKIIVLQTWTYRMTHDASA